MDTSNMTMEQMKARIAELEAKNAPKAKKLSHTVSERTGIIVVKGFGKFPVSLYEPDVRLLAAYLGDTLIPWLDENKGKGVYSEAKGTWTDKRSPSKRLADEAAEAKRTLQLVERATAA
jgi:hypothetical protein